MKKTTQRDKVRYVDGFILVIPKKKVAMYRKMAREAASYWMKHGALSFKECVGDDLNPDMGEYSFLPFKKLAKVRPHETVWFSYIEYKSKTDRDRINKKVMKEMDTLYKDKPNEMKDMPFDMKRFSYGGFKVEVSN